MNTNWELNISFVGAWLVLIILLQTFSPKILGLKYSLYELFDACSHIYAKFSISQGFIHLFFL
jgi:hypothetical protein